MTVELPPTTRTRAHGLCMLALCSRAQLKRWAFIDTCRRLNGNAPGDEKFAAPCAIGRARTCDDGMEEDLVEMCMALKKEYHKIDDSHIIMCTAELIGASTMTPTEKREAYTRVWRRRTLRAFPPCRVQFGGRKWLGALKKRHVELREFTVKRALERERAIKARWRACSARIANGARTRLYSGESRDDSRGWAHAQLSLCSGANQQGCQQWHVRASARCAANDARRSAVDGWVADSYPMLAPNFGGGVARRNNDVR